jgi:hypothetical protein
MKEKIIVAVLLILVICIIPVASDGTMNISGTTGVFIEGTDTTWPIMRNTLISDSWSNDSCSINVYSKSTTNQYSQLMRGYILFDTSSIPDDQSVYEAYLNFHVYGMSDQLSPSCVYFNIVDFLPANYESITTEDFDAFSDVAIDTYTIADFPVGYYNISIDPDLIDKTGYSAIGFRIDEDTSNSSIVWKSSSSTALMITSHKSSTAAKRPTLTVNYAASVSVSGVVTGDKDEGDTATFTDTVTGYSGGENITYYPELYLNGILIWEGEITTTELSDSRDLSISSAGDYSYRAHVNIDDADYYSSWYNWTAEEYTPPATYDYNYEVRVAGLDTNPIDGALVELWYNGSLQYSNTTTSSGVIYYNIPPYRTVNGTVSKAGYQNATFSQYINTWDTWSTVILYDDNETPGTGDKYWTYAVTFRDANTHENLDLVFIDLYTDSAREDLFLSEYRNGGVWTGLLPNDTTFYATASAVNYVDLKWSFTLNGASQSVFKDLVPVTYGSLQPVLNIFVYDTMGTPLNGVGVTVDSTTDDGFHLTNLTGYARHFCDNLAYGSSRNYTITAEKGGYITDSSTVTVSTQQPTVYIFMEKSAVPITTYTGVYTPVVTPVWSGDGGEPGNIKEQLINTLMTQFGLSQLEANILMGIILTLLCAVTVGGGLASYGSGSGAGVGAMIGAVVGFSGSSIIGFFPIWILIVVIVLVFAAWFMFRGRDE